MRKVLRRVCVLVLVGLAVVGWSGAQECVAPPADLLGWWPGDGSTINLGTTPNAVLAGNAGYAPGKLGQAFIFDGGDSVNVAQVPALNLSAAVTLELWVNPDPSSPTTGCQGLIGTDYYFIQTCDGMTYITVSTSAGGVQSVKATIPMGEWHHVAGTYDGAALRFYVDGALVEPVVALSGSIPPMLPASFLSIGSEDGRTHNPSDVGTRYFKGLIDEPAVYSRALSASEIAGIHAATSGKCKVYRDSVAAGTVQVGPGTCAHVPILVRDVPGTPLGVDQPADNRIQGLVLKVGWSAAACVASATFERAGILAPLEPVTEQSVRDGAALAYLALFDGATDPIPFDQNASHPGQQVATLHLGIAPTCPGGTSIALTFDATTTLSNEGGTLGESIGDASLAPYGGTVTVTARPATAVIASALSSSSARLHWQAPAFGETGFRVERSPDGSTWTSSATTAADVVTADVGGLTPATLHRFRVVALYGGVEAPPSNVAAAVTHAGVAARICRAPFGSGVAGLQYPKVSYPAVVHAGDRWAAVWQENAQGERQEVFFQRLDQVTGLPLAPRVRVSDTWAASAFPVVAWNGTHFGVVWAEFASGPTGPGSKAFFALLDADGARVRGGVRISPGGATQSVFGGYAMYPWQLFWDGSGWGLFASDGADPVGDWVYYRLDADGDRLLGPIGVHGTPFAQEMLHAAWNGSTYGLISEYYDATSARILFREMQGDGTLPAGHVELDQTGRDWWAGFRGSDLTWDGPHWVAAWTRGEPLDNPMYLQKIDAGGTPVGSPARLSDQWDPGFPPEDEVPVDDRVPQLLARAGGGYAVIASSWLASTGAEEITRLEADGALGKVGTRTVLSDDDGVAAQFPQATSDGSSILVAYQDNRQGSTELSDLIVDAGGTRTAGPVDLTTGHSAASAGGAGVVAVGEGFAALWFDSGSGSNQLNAQIWDGAGGVVAQRLPLVQRQPIAAPALVGLGAGFAAAWRDTANAAVFCRYDAAGNPLFGEVQVARPVNGVPALAFSGERFALAWRRGGMPRLQQVDLAGQPVEGQVTVQPPDGAQVQDPRVAWLGDGWGLVWVDRGNLYFAKVAPGGAVTVPATALTETGTAGAPLVMGQSSNTLALAWRDGRNGRYWQDLYFTVLDGNGVKAFPERSICPSDELETPVFLSSAGDRHRLVFCQRTGTFEVEILADGSQAGPPRRISNLTSVSGADCNGATVAILAGGLGGLQTLACLDDLTPPPCPTVTAAFDGSAVNLSWDQVSDPESAILSTFVHRDGGLLAELDATATSFSDRGWVDNTAHVYEVRVMSTAYLESQGCATEVGSRVHGDGNGDGILNVLDIFYLINHLFAGGPGPVGVGDCNGDGALTVIDIFYLINYLLAGGPPPV